MTQTRSVLVLGGGIAGMSAAKDLAASGLRVHLVEKETRIGGKARQWACMATDQCRNCGACLSAELVDQTRKLQNVTLYTETSVSTIDRTPDGFEAVLSGATATSLKPDAVLMATGFDLFDPTGFQSLGYSQHTRVITTAELNEALTKETLSRLLPDQPDPAIAFIQCVGSRNREIGRDYCSQVCCKTALRQADKLLHILPAAEISVFHMDLQIIGKEFRTQTAGLANRINLLQGVPAEVLTERAEDKLTVIREDFESGSRQAHHFDLIVLAVGMGPSKGTAELMEMLKLSACDWGFANHCIDSGQKGIYIAGAACSPMDILSAREQGAAAANRIIRDLGAVSTPRKLAVLGQGPECHQLAQTLAAENYATVLIDKGEAPLPSHHDLQHLTGSTLQSIQGTFGDFQLEIENPQGRQSVTVDAVVVANGVERHFPLESTGLKADPAIIALSDFDKQAEKDITTAPTKIVFQLDHFHPEWKDNCHRALLLADKLADQQKFVSILMDKMLVHGLYGQRLYDQARAKGVKFLRLAEGNQPVVKQNGSGLSITFKEATLPAIDLELQCDMLVIADQINPGAETSTLSRILNIECDSEGFLQSANVRHRQVGSPRRGIFFVGGCHDETDAADLAREIDAVCATLARLDKGSLENGNLPQIKEGHCVRCLTCLRVCPHGAITLKAFRQPTIAPQACFDCGLCVADCPAEAIAPLQVPPPQTAGTTAPHTVVFACQRSGALAADEACRMDICSNEKIEVIPVGCASRLNVETLLQPLVNGSSRVMIAACHSGNCRSTVGPENAAANVARIFTETRLPSTMLSYRSVAANEPAAFAAMVNDDRSDGKEQPHD